MEDDDRPVTYQSVLPESRDTHSPILESASFLSLLAGLQQFGPSENHCSETPDGYATVCLPTNYRG